MIFQHAHACVTLRWASRCSPSPATASASGCRPTSSVCAASARPTAGLVLGGGAAAAGWLGVTLGGLWADRWRRRSPAGRASTSASWRRCCRCRSSSLMLERVESLPLAFNWLIAQPRHLDVDRPGPRRCRISFRRALRATAAAAYLLVITFIGLALGPYTIGRLSVAFGDLRRRCCGVGGQPGRRGTAVARRATSRRTRRTRAARRGAT